MARVRFLDQVPIGFYDVDNTGGGGGGNPGGPFSSIQFNDGGNFNGSANLLWNDSTNTLTLIGKLNATSFTGSLQGTSSWAISSSIALLANTASYVVTAQTASYVLSSSYAFNSTSASYALTAGTIFPFTGSAIITGSLILTGSMLTDDYIYGIGIDGTNNGYVEVKCDILNQNIGGGFNVFPATGNTSIYFINSSISNSVSVYADKTVSLKRIEAPSFTGSLFGTSSWAISSSNSILSQTSSFVTSSNVYGPYGSNSILSSSYSQTSSYAVSASFAATASLAPNYVLNSVTASMLQPYVLTSQTSSMTVATASYVLNAISASYSSNTISASYAENALSASNTFLQQTLTSNITVGGLPSGTTYQSGSNIESILRKMLITYVAPTISNFSLFNGGSSVLSSNVVAEVSSSYTFNTASFTATVDNPNGRYASSASFTASGASIGNFNYYFGDNVLGNNNNLGLGSLRTINNSVNGTVTFTLNTRNPETNAVISQTRSITYVYPYYYGMSSIDYSITGDVSSSLTQLIQTQGTKTLSISGNSAYVYFCYPATYADLTSIKDGNGFEILSSFTKYTRNQNGPLGKWTNISYKIYRSNTLTNVSPAQNYIFT